jgi:hypothetical protein
VIDVSQVVVVALGSPIMRPKVLDDRKYISLRGVKLFEKILEPLTQATQIQHVGNRYLKGRALRIVDHVCVSLYTPRVSEGTVTTDELQAWTKFAAAALSNPSIVRDKDKPEMAAEIAEEYANALLDRRRIRSQSKQR